MSFNFDGQKESLSWLHSETLKMPDLETFSKLCTFSSVMLNQYLVVLAAIKAKPKVCNLKESSQQKKFQRKIKYSGLWTSHICLNDSDENSYWMSEDK